MTVTTCADAAGAMAGETTGVETAVVGTSELKLTVFEVGSDRDTPETQKLPGLLASRAGVCRQAKIGPLANISAEGE